MEKLSLNGQWTLYGCPEKKGLPNRLDEIDLNSCCKITATVPGNVELALMEADILPDPFYGDNLYLYAPYEYWQWIYKRTFKIPKEMQDKEMLI